MTLSYWLRHIHSRPKDLTSPLLCVAEGFLSKDDEARVTSPEYDGLPYCYLLNVGDAEIVTYHSGRARYLNPIDVVFEARDEASEPYLWQLYWGMRNLFRDDPWKIDEIEPGLSLITPFEIKGKLRPESRSSGFWETMLRLESSSL